MSETPLYPHIINGERREPLSGDYADVINPATGQVVGRAAMGNAADVDTAVSAARAAFDNREWRHMPPAQRSKVLYQCAQLVMANAQELIELEIGCSGATLTRASNMDIPAVADLWMNLAEAVKTYPFVEAQSPRPLPEQWHSQVWKEPVGVCGLITAWNFPLLLFGFKVGPALAAGNTIVLKPSELTPTSSIRLAEILQEALPPGVLNVVNGDGPSVGETMTLHPDIDKISFTGSTRIGKQIQANCATTLKRCTLELGGKGPGIVMSDANLDMVAETRGKIGESHRGQPGGSHHRRGPDVHRNPLPQGHGLYRVRCCRGREGGLRRQSGPGAGLRGRFLRGAYGAGGRQ
jgi:aldehyde dehydrogenase (NAD+)